MVIRDGINNHPSYLITFTASAEMQCLLGSVFALRCRAFKALAYSDVGSLPTLAPNFRDPGVSCARSMALHSTGS